MNGLDTLLMSDWEIWITLIVLGGVGSMLVRITPDFAPSRRRRGTTITLAAGAAMALAALLASYSLPPTHAAAELVAESGRG